MGKLLKRVMGCLCSYFHTSFNDKLKSLLEVEPYSSMTTNQIYKKMVDYLFLVWQEDGELTESDAMNSLLIVVYR